MLTQGDPVLSGLKASGMLGGLWGKGGGDSSLPARPVNHVKAMFASYLFSNSLFCINIDPWCTDVNMFGIIVLYVETEDIFFTRMVYSRVFSDMIWFLIMRSNSKGLKTLACCHSFRGLHSEAEPGLVLTWTWNNSSQISQHLLNAQVMNKISK